MGGSRLERLAPLTGVVFVVLLVVGRFGFARRGFPGFLGSADEITTWYTDYSTQLIGGGYLKLLAVFFFLWFVGSLRSFLRSAERGTGRLSAVAFGGGVAAGALYLASFTMSLTAAFRAEEPGGIGAQAATTLFDLGGVLFSVAVPMALAVLMAATAIVGFRTAVLPTWLAWDTAVTAVGLLAGPVACIVHSSVFLAWVLFISVFLYLRGAKIQAASTAPTA